jgi:uncharacterized membrane protein YhaH (DUF805 family)
MSTPAPQPGWYADPGQPGMQRYWDGATWTEHQSPLPAAPAYLPRLEAAPQVGFVDAVKLGFRKYAVFSGRATRAEFWWWYLFEILAFVPLYVVLVAVSVTLPPSSSTEKASGTTVALILVLAVLMLVLALGLVVPTIAVMVRRLHDTGRSGWWYWISLIPFGSLVLLVFLVTESQPHANEYGLPSRGAADLEG